MDGYERLFKLFSGVNDPRGRNGRVHILAEVLFCSFVAILAGANDAEAIVDFVRRNEEWFRRFVVLPGGVFAHDMVLRAFALVDPDEFEAVIRAWVESLRERGVVTTEGGQVAIDGKALRGSVSKASKLRAVHMVGAYLIDAGLTLGTIKVDDKSNEITAIPDLIRALNLRGATVTIDAMGCQTAIAAEIIDAGANYVLQVKGNQPILQDNIAQTFKELMRRRKPGEPKVALDRYRDVDKGHGRVEQRSCVLSRDLSGIENAQAWAGLTGVALVAREVENLTTKKVTKELAYFLLSDAAATARDVAKPVRNHWAIESTLHWSLDVTFGEDAHRVIHRKGAANMARMRRLAHGMIKNSTGYGMSMARVRLVCGWDPDNLLTVLTGGVIARPRLRRKLDPKRFKSPKTK